MFNPSQCRLKVSEKIGSLCSSPVAGTILEISFFLHSLGNFEECCRINKRCKVLDKFNFLSLQTSSALFSNRCLGLMGSVSSHSQV